MKTAPFLLTISLSCLVWQGTAAAEPALTIYNQDFAVVRETVPLGLAKGINEIRHTDMTAHLEPDSVMLRDPAGKRALQILEQNYRADPVSQGLLLSLYEGETIDFLVHRGEETEIVQGKIVRSGYVPHSSGMRRYGQDYRQRQTTHASGAAGQPIIEVDGKLRFGLPGTPLFPALKDDTILKPTIHWVIETNKAGQLDAELCYVTGGMSWEADYNLIVPEKGKTLDLVGWVTMDNQSGKAFEHATIKLMAGDVSKIQRETRRAGGWGGGVYLMDINGMAPPVSEKAFDEYHLYTLRRPTTLHDRETKQVEFIRAEGVEFSSFYVYDGAKFDDRRYDLYARRTEPSYGTQCNPKVWVMREFENAKANHLGIPLPKGRVRFYRRDDDKQLEFTGENIIDHTPRDETVRVYTGNAFDLVGKRVRTDFKVDRNADWCDESFAITLRNHKEQKVEIRVVEHMYRWTNWEITESSNVHMKTDSQTIEFRIQVRPDEETTITYSVHYTW